MNRNEFDLNKTIVSVHEINDSVRNPKLRTYKIFRKDIRIEPYLYHDPPGKPSRIPIISVTGTNGKTTTTRLIAHIVKNNNYKVGFTTSDGI